MIVLIAELQWMLAEVGIKSWNQVMPKSASPSSCGDDLFLPISSGDTISTLLLLVTW